MSEPFDIHEYAKAMFDRLDIDSERTLTGRFPSRPPLPYHFPPTNVQEATGVSEEASKTFHMALDFGELESRTVAYIVGIRGGKMHIIEQLSIEQMYQGKKTDLCIIDDYALYDESEDYINDEPIKQNGRSAAYLKHDKTKKHGRRR